MWYLETQVPGNGLVLYIHCKHPMAYQPERLGFKFVRFADWSHVHGHHPLQEALFDPIDLTMVERETGLRPFRKELTGWV